MYLLKLPGRIHGMWRPLPAHAIGNDLTAQELPTQGADVLLSLYKSELLSKNSSASRRKRERAVFMENCIRSTPITLSCASLVRRGEIAGS